MEESDLDTHICLVCHVTIIGLEQYVKHKKQECPGKKSKDPISHSTHSKSPKSDFDSKFLGIQQHSDTPITSSQAETSQQLSMSSPTLSSSIPVSHVTTCNSNMSPSNRAIDNNIMICGEASPKDISITDFLSSLELQSRGPPEAIKASKGGHPNPTPDYGKSPEAEDRLDDHKSLRIASILNDLAFSDGDEDEEDELPNIDADNLMALVEDDEHPPRSHTGGKWRPGAAPPAGGKWKPSSKLLAMSKHRQSAGKSGTGKKMPTDESGKKPVESQPHDGKNKARNKTENANGQKANATSKTICCECCERNFQTVTSYDRHVLSRYHKRRETKPCEHSDQSRAIAIDSENNDENKRNEENKSNEDGILECPVCDKHYNSKYNFARHLVSTYHQKRAGKDTRQFLLNESMQMILLKQSPYQCRICHFYCIEEKSFSEHVKNPLHQHKMRLLVGPALCVQCKFNSYDCDDIAKHFKNVQHVFKKGYRPYILKEKRHLIKCQQCDLLFHSAASLQRHTKFSHKKSKHDQIKRERGQHQKPRCPYCQLQCASLSALHLHVRRMHIKEKKFRCNVCQRSFADSYTLNLHEQTKYHYKRVETAAALGEAPNHPMTGPTTEQAILAPVKDKDKKMYCSTCGLYFSSLGALKAHIKNAQKHQRMIIAMEQGSVVQCTECDEKFDSKNAMNDHYLDNHSKFSSNIKNIVGQKDAGIDAKHLGFLKSIEKARNKVVTCPECNKRVGRHNIYVHLRQHSKTKPFGCSMCEECFADPKVLKQHIRYHTTHIWGIPERHFSGSTLSHGRLFH